MFANRRFLKNDDLTARLVLTAFVGYGLLFVLADALKVHLVILGMCRDAAISRWPRADCVITASSWRRTSRSWRGCPRFVFEVEYQYTFEGQKYTSRTVSRGYRMSFNSWQAKQLAQEYPSEAQASCYVNPRDPSSAVLRKNPIWTDRASLILFFGVVSLATAWGCVRVVWRLTGRKGTPARPAHETKPSLSKSRAGGPPGKWTLAAFLLVGCSFGYVMIGRPVLSFLAAREWHKTPCVIVSGKAHTYRTAEGTCHRVSVAYAYEVNGRRYTSNRHELIDASPGRTDRLRQFLQMHPVDAQAECYVNPANPSEAVLDRSFICHGGPVAAVPVIFALIGAGGLIYLFFRNCPRAAYGPGPNQSLHADAAGRRRFS